MDKYLAIIPNTIDPYGYEIIHVLAYPVGFEYRFRFDEKWVDKTTAIQSDIIGKKGYILLREFATATLYPIRYFTLKSFKKIGKIYYFEVTLEELVAIDTDDDHAKKQIDDFQKAFTRFNSSVIDNNCCNGHMAPLVFLTNYKIDIRNEHKRSDDNEEVESWGNILSRFKDVDFFDDVQFLRLIGVEGTEGSDIGSCFENGKMVLKEGKNYRVKLAQFIPRKSSKKALKPTEIKLTSDDFNISVLRGTQRAVGRYDIITFFIRANKTDSSGESFLDINHVPKSSGSDVKGEPNLYIPIKITRSNRRFFISGLVILLSVLFYFGPSVAGLLNKCIPTFFEEFIKDISIVGLSVGLISFIDELRRFKK